MSPDLTRRGFLGGLGAMAGLLTAGGKAAALDLIAAPAELEKWIAAEPDAKRIARWFKPDEVLAIGLRDPEPVYDKDGKTILYRRAMSWDCTFRDSRLGIGDLEQGDPLILRIEARPSPVQGHWVIEQRPLLSRPAPSGMAWEGLAKIVEMHEEAPISGMRTRTFKATSLEPLRRVVGVDSQSAAW